MDFGGREEDSFWQLIASLSKKPMANMAAGNDTKGGVNWQNKFGQAWKQSDNRGFYL